MLARVDPRDGEAVPEPVLPLPEAVDVQACDGNREDGLRLLQVVAEDVRHDVLPEGDAADVAHVQLGDDE